MPKSDATGPDSAFKPTAFASQSVVTNSLSSPSRRTLTTSMGLSQPPFDHAAVRRGLSYIAYFPYRNLDAPGGVT